MTKAPSLPPPDPVIERSARELAARAPVPAVLGGLWFGTAGWTDPTLLAAGTFYPPEVKSAAERLRYYASHFSLVEVDSTYYAIPAPSVAAQWAERTPSSFLFDIKAHPIFTGHPIDRTRLPRDIADALQNVSPDKKRLYPNDLPDEARQELQDRFRRVLTPLREAGKLGCVMVQLPPWTTATRGADRSLEALSSQLPDTPIAVEFRHPSWVEPARRPRVLDVLRAHRLSYVVVDEPDVVGGGVPPLLEVTRPQLAVVRFHGHNLSGWRRGATVQERFNYLYAPHELQAWTAPLTKLAGEAEKVHAVFNNCVRDFAVLNAKNLAALLANPS